MTLGWADTQANSWVTNITYTSVIEDMQWISEDELKTYSPKVLKSYVTWAKKHKRMMNNVPEFAHVDELEADDSPTGGDGNNAE